MKQKQLFTSEGNVPFTFCSIEIAYAITDCFTLLETSSNPKANIPAIKTVTFHANILDNAIILDKNSYISKFDELNILNFVSQSVFRNKNNSWFILFFCLISRESGNRVVLYA